MKDYSIFIHTAVLKHSGSYRVLIELLSWATLVFNKIQSAFFNNEQSKIQNFVMGWLNRKTHIQHFYNRAKFGWQ